MYNDTGLRPWTPCEYKVHAWNSASRSWSSWTATRTTQAPPEGLSPPEITCVSVNLPKLLISWLPPEQANSLLLAYRLHRNAGLQPLSFDAMTFNHTGGDLLPFSAYSYAITACTGGGCSTSHRTDVTTPEAAPAGLHAPTLRAVSATQINASWAPPSMRNGRIPECSLRRDGQEHHAGQNLSLLVAHLQPYTQHHFYLVTCMGGGCTSSVSTSAWTMEAPPENMDPPNLQVTGSESTEVTWKPPRSPSGQIRSYELRRDGTIVYTGLDTRYHDFTLAPGVEYGYAVTASNSQGCTLSPLVRDRTIPSAPSGVKPPKLQARGPREILVTWDPPVSTDGHIINYTLFLHEPFERETTAIHVNATQNAFGAQALTVQQLKPFHR